MEDHCGSTPETPDTLEARRGSGFTFIELLITLSILAIISTISLMVFRETIRTYMKSGAMLDIQANGAHALSVIEQRIRSAKSIVAYENYLSCSLGCSSNWLLLSSSRTPAGSCDYLGVVTGGGANPDIWTENGYVFLQETANCAALDLAALELLEGAPSGDPLFSEPQVLTNYNQADPVNGVNVSQLEFVVDNTRDNPPTVSISLEIRQGVLGTAEDPPPDRKVRVNLESTVSLR